MSIRLIYDFVDIEVPYMTYPGGEVSLLNQINPVNVDCEIYAQIKNENDFAAVRLLKDVLDRNHKRQKTIKLTLPYVPYARQDRCIADVKGNQAHALRVFTNVLNSLKFDLVEIWDPHSDVAHALIDNCVVRPMYHFTRFLGTDCALLSPDLGAAKKIEKVAEKQQITSIAYGLKHRDPSSGILTAPEIINEEALAGKHVWICDDICDGGRTFLNLAQVVNCSKILSLNLFVTHGIFSNGIDGLLDVFDEVVCANLMVDQTKLFRSNNKNFSMQQKHGLSMFYPVKVTA